MLFVAITFEFKRYCCSRLCGFNALPRFIIVCLTQYQQISELILLSQIITSPQYNNAGEKFFYELAGLLYLLVSFASQTS